MKKLTKILIIALSIALLCGAFIFSASANEAATAPEATTVNAFRVQNPDEQAVEVVTIAQAFSAVKNGGTIKMIADYEDGANRASYALGADKKNVTLDLNGHTFAASYATQNKEDNSEGPCYQKFNISGVSLTVVGNGTMKAATSLFNITSGGTVTFNAGEDNTINLVAIHGYNATTGELSGLNFPGGHFIKVNTNAVNTGIGTLNVYGNLNFVDETGKTNLCLFAYTDGSLINIENATINSTNNGTDGGIFANHFTATYDKETYDAPVINIENSVINAPYGTFLKADNKATDYSDAVTLNVINSTLNLVGDNYPTAKTGNTSAVIRTTTNSPIKVVMDGAKVYTDTNFFYNQSTGADVVPKTTIQLNNSLIGLDTADTTEEGEAFNWSNSYNYRRYFFYGTVTAIVENTVLAHDSCTTNTAYIDNALIHTHAWANKATAEAAGKTDPGYFGELGMGVLFKSGTAFVDCRSDALGTAVAAGAYSNDKFTGYAFDYGCSLVSNKTVVNNGATYTGKLVTPYITGANLEGATVGAYTDGTAVQGGSFGDLKPDAIKDRHGKYAICEYAGNKYVTHTAQAGTNANKSDPHVAFSFSAGSSGAYTHAIDTARFYSFELDMAKAALKHSEGNFYIGFLFRPAASYVTVGLSTDANGKSVWKIGNTTLADAPVANAGVWQHVQAIIEAPVNDSGAFEYDPANGKDINIYLYLDGELAGSATLTEASSAIATSISNATDLKTVAITEVRYKFPTSYKANDTGATALDNFAMARYPIAYTGNATTAEGIRASIVNTNYTLPKDFSEELSVVKVDGEKYSDIDAAVAKLISLAKNGHVPTLEYIMDFSNYTFDLSAAETGAKFIFKTGGKALKLQSDYVAYSGAYAGELGEGETLVVHKYYNAFSTPHTQNIQNATTGTYTDGTKVVGSFGTNGLPVQASRNGKYTVYEQADGNKYVAHTAQLGTNTYKHDQFISLGYSAGSQSNYDAPIDGYRFYSYEMDLASAELKHSRGDFVIDFLFRGGATRGGEFKERITEYVGAYFTTNADGISSWKIGSKAIDAPVAAAGVWQHVQFIIEAPVVEYNEGSYKYSASFDAANLANFKFHLYLDGELAGTATLEEANKTLYDLLANNPADKKNYDSLKNLAVTEVRFRTAGTYYADDTGSTAFDNIRMERYSINYIGDKNSGAAVLASVVNTEYTLPANLPLVNVDGTDYCTIADAVAALKNGSTLEYLMDVSSLEFDLSAFTNGETFTFKTNGAAPKIAATSLYVADGADGTYTVRPATADEKATMTWYNKDGSVLLTQTVLKGQELQMYVNPNPEVIVNDYYKATYDAWKLDDNTFLVKGGTETVILNADRSAYPAATLESTFTDVKFNVGLNDNLVANFFVPQEIIAKDGTGADGVTFVGVLINTEKPNDGKYTAKYSALEIGGKGYDLFVGYPGYHAFANNAYCIVTYTVTLDGLTYTLAPKFEITPLAYAEIVLDEKNTAFAAEDKTHVANLLRFSNEFIRAKNGAYDTSVKGVYEIYKDLCTAYEEDLLAETDVADLENDPIWDYVSAIYVKVSNGRAQYSIDFKADSKVTAVEIWKTHADGSFAKIGFYEPQNKKFDGTSYYSNYNTANLRFYDFFGTLEIRLTVDGKDDQVIGHYDVNTWYNNAEMTDDEKAIWGDFLMALKELGDTFYDYRFRLPVSEEE